MRSVEPTSGLARLGRKFAKLPIELFEYLNPFEITSRYILTQCSTADTDGLGSHHHSSMPLSGCFNVSTIPCGTTLNLHWSCIQRSSSSQDSSNLGLQPWSSSQVVSPPISSWRAYCKTFRSCAAIHKNSDVLHEAWASSKITSSLVCLQTASIVSIVHNARLLSCVAFNAITYRTEELEHVETSIAPVPLPKLTRQMPVKLKKNFFHCMFVSRSRRHERMKIYCFLNKKLTCRLLPKRVSTLIRMSCTSVVWRWNWKQAITMTCYSRWWRIISRLEEEYTSSNQLTCTFIDMISFLSRVPLPLSPSFARSLTADGCHFNFIFHLNRGMG